jgi:hypothetical protein
VLRVAGAVCAGFCVAMFPASVCEKRGETRNEGGLGGRGQEQEVDG